MADHVITLNVGRASIPIYREDWPAVKAAVSKAMAGAPGRNCQAPSKRESVSACRYLVAEKTRFQAVDHV